MSFQLEIQLIAIVVSVACSLVGSFLVLRKMSMTTDSITHTILLGIVLGFFIVHDLNSPILIVGAAAMGVITVWLTELLNKSRLVSEDSAIGIVFPLLFSIAVILISRYAGHVHLDIDSVMLGELAFAPFERLIVGGADIGPVALYVALAMLLANILFIVLFFKELKLVTFDPVLAAVLGFAPSLIHYALMFMVSLTAVGSFQSVGSILVVAFMIGPPATAYLMTNDVKRMLLYGALLGAFNAVAGFQISSVLDVSIAGSMAVVTGLTFLVVFIVQPQRGLLRTLYKKRLQKLEIDRMALIVHITHHADSPAERRELSLVSLHKHFQWDARHTRDVFSTLERDGLAVMKPNGVIHLTAKGEEYREEYL